MSRFKLRLFLFLAVLALSEQNEIQSEFDEALNQFAKRERPEFKFPKRRLADKKIKQSFKRSSRSAMQLNDLYDLQRKFTAKQTKRGIPGKIFIIVNLFNL
jgi:hypothetical protein